LNSYYSEHSENDDSISEDVIKGVNHENDDSISEDVIKDVNHGHDDSIGEDVIKDVNHGHDDSISEDVIKGVNHGHDDSIGEDVIKGVNHGHGKRKYKCVPNFDWIILNSKPIRFVVSSCQFKGEYSQYNKIPVLGEIIAGQPVRHG
jgi:hypothetical protein